MIPAAQAGAILDAVKTYGDWRAQGTAGLEIAEEALSIVAALVGALTLQGPRITVEHSAHSVIAWRVETGQPRRGWAENYEHHAGDKDAAERAALAQARNSWERD